PCVPGPTWGGRSDPPRRTGRRKLPPRRGWRSGRWRPWGAGPGWAGARRTASGRARRRPGSARGSGARTPATGLWAPPGPRGAAPAGAAPYGPPTEDRAPPPADVPGDGHPARV